MKIDAPVKRGMIKIGLPRFGPACDYAGTYIRTNGVMEFKGSACFCNGASVSVLGGRLVLGDKVYFGEKVRIVCVNYITIGEGTRIAHESQLMDTNFHYMLDISKKQISYPKGEIKIGKWCWVGNRTTIQKGTVLPDNTIVASNSLLNKDYSDIPECSVIGGMPAKLIKQGMRRIFNVRTEHMLNVFFKENGYDAKYFYDGLDQDAFCQ